MDKIIQCIVEILSNYLVRFSTSDISLLSDRFAITCVFIRVFIRRRHFGIKKTKKAIFHIS